MYAEFYAHNPLLFWALVGLVFFITSFVAVLLYVFIGLRDKRKVDYLAGLPLEPDGQRSAESRDIGVAQGRA